jgi:hypothetical protein
MAHMFENLCTLYEHSDLSRSEVIVASAWTLWKALRQWESNLLQLSRLSTRCTHSFSLLWCSFLEIIGGSLFRSGGKRGLLAQCIARCSFQVATALRFYFLRLHHMTYIRSWAMRFWSWKVLKAELNCWNRAAFVIVVICDIICEWDDCYLCWVLRLSRSIQSSIQCLSMTTEPCGSLLSF